MSKKEFVLIKTTDFYGTEKGEYILDINDILVVSRVYSAKDCIYRSILYLDNGNKLYLHDDDYIDVKEMLLNWEW